MADSSQLSPQYLKINYLSLPLKPRGALIFSSHQSRSFPMEVLAASP